jgi:hypothetical protein
MNRASTGPTVVPTVGPTDGPIVGIITGTITDPIAITHTTSITISTNNGWNYW